MTNFRASIYLEIDLVHHCGISTRGDYRHTLTGWTELRVLRNRARIWTVNSVPFSIHTWHSDNGSEFLNGHLIAYAEKHRIDLTRSLMWRVDSRP
ncbi:hypothetical protein DRP53_01895 [candidate division WOR-3 bacterium]|uniref:Integrase catalytic domain-containing protein n=1 Tax=candidate division WOR-3 bacterium TaxID=2052148 RepID=A0A660SKT4_UNCW3|nr:MAG: hypothetical protein DRP53_01895 [candidate division WOR-3 bacterium]